MGGGLADSKTFCLKRLNVVVWGWYTTVMNGERNEKILCRVQQCIPIHKTCLKNTSFPFPSRPWAFPLLIIWPFSYTLAGKNGASYKRTTTMTMTMTTWWKKNWTIFYLSFSKRCEIKSVFVVWQREARYYLEFYAVYNVVNGGWVRCRYWTFFHICPLAEFARENIILFLTRSFFFFTIESRLNRTIIKALVQTIECFSYSLYKYQFSNEHLLCMTLHCQ